MDAFEIKLHLGAAVCWLRVRRNGVGLVEIREVLSQIIRRTALLSESVADVVVLPEAFGLDELVNRLATQTAERLAEPRGHIFPAV